MRPLVQSALLLIAVAGLLLCVAQAATPAPTRGVAGAPGTSSASSELTVPPVAGLSDGAPSATVTKVAAQTSRPATSPTVRATTPRPSASPAITASPSTRPPTPSSSTTPTGVAVIPTAEAAGANGSAGARSTPSTVATVPDYASPTAERTPDIDPGMTPYSGPTAMETIEETPTWEAPVASATPTDAAIAPPPPSGAAGTPGYELPPGAYGVETTPTPTVTDTPAPLLTAEPPVPAPSSILPRWTGYLVFVLIGVSGMAGLALVGAYLGARRGDGGAPRPAMEPSTTVRGPGPRLPLRNGAEPTAEQEVLLDRIGGFEPATMPVERLGRTLLRLENASRLAARDPYLRLGEIVSLAAIPSAPVPAPAAAWAGAHGFRILAVDGTGMALVMPALPAGGRTVLGVLPAADMVGGATLAPMAIRPAEPASGTGALRPAMRASAA